MKNILEYKLKLVSTSRCHKIIILANQTKTKPNQLSAQNYSLNLLLCFLLLSFHVSAAFKLMRKIFGEARLVRLACAPGFI